jgi:sec-independent protein translocase protein TatA
MPNLRGFEWVVLILLIVVLFGAKRLPDAARGLGRSLRIFKAETKGLRDDESADASTTTVQQRPPASIPPVDPGTQVPPAPTPAPQAEAQPTPARGSGEPGSTSER